MSAFTIHFDAACPPRRPLGIGVVAFDNDEPDEPIAEWSYQERVGTSNEGEYLALIAAINLALLLQADHADFRGDSLLIVEQTLGHYTVRKETLRPYWEQAQRLLGFLPSWTLAHVPRARNSYADKLSKACATAANRRWIDARYWTSEGV